MQGPGGRQLWAMLVTRLASGCARCPVSPGGALPQAKQLPRPGSQGPPCGSVPPGSGTRPASSQQRAAERGYCLSRWVGPKQGSMARDMGDMGHDLGPSSQGTAATCHAEGPGPMEGVLQG